jgi:deoxyribodipyrimidine photo-lyase
MLPAILVWFRRDLRDTDHAALAEAMRRGQRVFCVFVFDRELLDVLPTPADRRVEFIRESLVELDAALRRRGGALIIRHAFAVSEIPRLAAELGVTAVFANRDYEPQTKARDAKVAAALAGVGIGFESFKDQVLFDGPEVLSQSGRPYTVFTPYKKAWLKRLSEDDLAPHDQTRGNLAKASCAQGVPSLEEIGFRTTDLRRVGIVPGMTGARQLLGIFVRRLACYHEQRDFPALEGVSRLSVHLRFGTISVRELVAVALAEGARAENEGAASWLSELIWRDFYFMILDHFPQVVGHSFKAHYDAIAWEQGQYADRLFAAWCAARTGYPLIDAAMRQLNSTGYMHNRLRMLVASFLTKDLGLDWRRGEAYFARQLVDFDLAANNGGWQWAASSGCDAQPYFRIFNPLTQSRRFDPGGSFIRHYLPELAAVPDKFVHAPWSMPSAEQLACGVIVGRHTPPPLVLHEAARQLTLARYALVTRRAGA